MYLQKIGCQANLISFPKIIDLIAKKNCLDATCFHFYKSFDYALHHTFMTQSALHNIDELMNNWWINSYQEKVTPMRGCARFGSGSGTMEYFHHSSETENLSVLTNESLELYCIAWICWQDTFHKKKKKCNWEWNL